MKRILVCVAAVGVFGLAGCGGGPTVEAPPAGQEVEVSDPAAGEDVPAPAGETTAAGPAAGTEVFGSTATWPDGVSVTVSAPKPFKPSEYAAGAEGGGEFVVVDVTLKNGGSEPAEASMLLLRATSGDVESESVFDSEKDVGGTTARVMPGKTTKWKAAFSKPGDDLLVTVDWGFSGQPVTFQEG